MSVSDTPADAAGTVLYEVDCEIHPDRMADFERWLPAHMSELLAQPGFIAARSFDAGRSTDDWVRVTNVYQVRDIASVDRYFAEGAPRIQADTRATFGDQLRATRRVLVARSSTRRAP